MSVPAVIVCRVAQAKITREIDNAVGHSSKLVNPRPRSAVGQRQEEQVTRFKFGERRELQPGLATQVRVPKVGKLPGIGLRRDLDDLDLRVKQQDTQELAPSVPRRTYN